MFFGESQQDSYWNFLDDACKFIFMGIRLFAVTSWCPWLFAVIFFRGMKYTPVKLGIIVIHF